ncbi:MAG: nickel pincer cofactor biosynthesis protein LarC [Gemmatimonadetes bacterium]|nr:nickel pincer cofactor biosynthesis protein LarC [Gemmatimonadota bacterium]
MRIGYLDMFSGVSGDMLLGACLDAGVPLEELREALSPLGLEGVRLDVERVERNGIAASRCVVEVPDAQGRRGLAEIVAMLEGAELPEPVVERSVRVFRRLAAAEAKVHGTTVDRIHFHEVGALDAIVDVVGGVWCLERLGVDRLHASTFTLGRGWTESAHGRLPVPPPAVMELVAGWPVCEGPLQAELTTPTGAALVTTLAQGRGLPADFVPETTGYGAGTREHEEQPNVLRLVLGTVAEGAEELAVVECDVDDLSPELFEPVAEALYEAGAREVVWIPVQMKKRRPGVTIRALAPAERLEAVGRALFRESPTLGYRWWTARRETLAREEVEVETSLGRVAAKRIRRLDGRWEVRPEFDACRRIARERGLPVREVARALERELAADSD